MRSGRPLRLAATAAGVAAFGGLLATSLVAGTLRDGVVPVTIGWYLLAFVGFGLAVVGAELTWQRGERVPWQWLWLVPIGFRVLLWFTEPTLSDDVYRYLWDGHVLTEGINPYRFPVDAVELDGAEVGVRSLVNNPSFSTPYLPAAQGLFAAVALVLPLTATSMQIVMTLFDLATAALIVKLLTATGHPTHRVVLYLWNPLVIVEVAHGAHLDALMTALLLGALAASASTTGTGAGTPGPADGATVGVGTGRLLASPLLLAAATLTRGLPALAAAVLWWRWNWRQRLAYLAGCVIPILGFGLGAGFGFGDSGPSPAAVDGVGSGGPATGVFGSARAYAELWRFNTTVFPAVADMATALIGGDDPARGDRLARLVVGGVMLAVVGVVAHRARRRAAIGPPNPISLRSDLRAVAVLLAAYVVLTTTLHPWYLLALMAFLPFLTPTLAEAPRRWLTLAPWLYLCAAVVLSYLTYADPDAHAELAWVRRVEWWPALGLLAGLAVAALRSLLTDRPDSAAGGRIGLDGHGSPRPPAVPGRGRG